MKIAYIVLKGMPVGGGIEKYTEEVGARLAAKGHEVTVYATRNYGALDGIYKGMHIRTVPTVCKRSFEKMSASFMATMHQIIKGDADVIHFHAFGPAAFCMIPKMLGRNVIVQGHGLEWKRSKWNIGGRMFLRLTEIPSVSVPDALTVVSKEQQRYLKEKYRKDSTYIPTGVNVPQFENPDLIQQFGLTGNDYILFAARLVREKGVHYLIEAYNRLKTDVKLVIAGDAQLEEKYKSELHRLAAGNERIIFTGFASGKLLCELYSNARIFVLPSEIEGLPTALLEAMSYGNCCLVSDIPENLEAMNGLGYSFKNGDVTDLRAQLEFLASNQTARDAYKEHAKEHVLANHSWDMIADRFESLYKAVVQPKVSDLLLHEVR